MRNIVASGMLYGTHITVKQISKPKALKLFCSGETIYMQASNMYPFGIWQSLCSIELDLIKVQSNIDCLMYCAKNIAPLTEKEQSLLIVHNSVVKQFNDICNEYRYYNCCSERGKYINFYQIVK